MPSLSLPTISDQQQQNIIISLEVGTVLKYCISMYSSPRVVSSSGESGLWPQRRGKVRTIQE